MKKIITKRFSILLAISWVFPMLISSSLFAQDTTAAKTVKAEGEPVKKTFEHGILINNQTVETPFKKSIDAVILHRFGTVVDNEEKFDYNEFMGVYKPANIRLGIGYGITDNLSVGIGATKFKKIYDLEWKYKMFEQKTTGMPVSAAYYGDCAVNTTTDDNFLISEDGKKTVKVTSRLSYYHELMISRKINNNISVQASVNYTHFNLVDSVVYKDIKHDAMGIGFIGRYKFSPQSSILIEYNHPLTTWKDVKTTTASGVTTTTEIYYPKPNLGIGYEVSTGSHQFQIFLTTADGIINQEMKVYGKNDIAKKQLLLGFNLTRMWGF